MHWVSKTYVVRLLLRPDDAVLIESVSFLGGRSPISAARVLSRSRLCTLRWCCFRTTYVATKSELAAVYESIHPFVNFSAANGTRLMARTMQYS